MQAATHLCDVSSGWLLDGLSVADALLWSVVLGLAWLLGVLVLAGAASLLALVARGSLLLGDVPSAASSSMRSKTLATSTALDPMLLPDDSCLPSSSPEYQGTPSKKNS